MSNEKFYAMCGTVLLVVGLIMVGIVDIAKAL